MKTLGKTLDILGWTFLCLLAFIHAPVLILAYLLLRSRGFRVALIGALAIFLLLSGLPELLGPRVPVAVCP